MIAEINMKINVALDSKLQNTYHSPPKFQLVLPRMQDRRVNCGEYRVGQTQFTCTVDMTEIDMKMLWVYTRGFYYEKAKVFGLSIQSKFSIGVQGEITVGHIYYCRANVVRTRMNSGVKNPLFFLEKLKQMLNRCSKWCHEACC